MFENESLLNLLSLSLFEKTLFQIFVFLFDASVAHGRSHSRTKEHPEMKFSLFLLAGALALSHVHAFPAHDDIPDDQSVNHDKSKEISLLQVN